MSYKIYLPLSDYKFNFNIEIRQDFIIENLRVEEDIIDA